MKDLRIFVASSRELERERNYLAYLVLANEEEFAKRGFRVRLAKWEYVDPKMTAERTEDRYLEEMYNCDAAFVLFKNIVGTYTREEMAKAIAAEQGGWSRLKAHRILFSAAGAQDSGAARLRESLSSDGYGVYSNMDELQEAFLSLVDYVAKCERLLDAPSDKHVHKIAAFLAADSELAEDRNAFADTVLNVNDLLEQGHLNVRVQLKFYDSANAEKVVESSEMGLVLYGTNYRVLGREDVERIHARMKDGKQNPKCVYVFFRNLDDFAEEVLDEAFKRFRSELESRFEHFSCHFGDANGIRAVFDEFLLRYVGGMIDKKDTKELYSTVTAPTASAFVGREDELRKLHELLEPVPDRFPVGRLPIITGAGGTGKSELVRQYASQFRVQYPGGVLQVDMEHVKTWDEAFLGILKGVSNNGVKVDDYLGLKAKNEEEQEREPLTGAKVRDALLKKARMSGPILLVLDNVEEFTSLLERDGGFTEAFPAGFSERVRVNVVATARACDVMLRSTDWAVLFPLADLSPESALELLLKDKPAEGEKELAAAKRIAELLGYRALYVRRVPAILSGDNKKSRIVCRSYASLAKALEKDSLLTINRTATVDDKYLPACLWELVQNSLAEWGLGEACIKLIKIASFFSPDGFAKHILRHLWEELVFPGLEDLGSKDEVFDEVVDLAKRYNIFQSVDPVRIHRLDRAAILQSAQSEPGLEGTIGKSLGAYDGMSPEDWLYLAERYQLIKHTPLTMFTARPGMLVVFLYKNASFAEDCPWDMLTGRDWAWLIELGSQFADKCPWEKLDGWDWAALLGRRPQFADRCPWGKLNGCNWVKLLGYQPQFADRCPWEKLDACDWLRLLCGDHKGSGAQPQFADRCPWEKLDGREWAKLLASQPQFADRCPWEKFDGYAWADLLSEQPQFAGNCSWEKVKDLERWHYEDSEEQCSIWGRLLGRQPQFADRCPWEKLDGSAWAELLGLQPQFADRCPWEKLDGYNWTHLLGRAPQFSEQCRWAKLNGENCAELLERQPQLVERCQFEMFTGRDWCRLLGGDEVGFSAQPQLADRCAWEKLDGYDWAYLLGRQPQFADKCLWEKLNVNDWVMLLDGDEDDFSRCTAQPQFAAKCHFEELDDDDLEVLLDSQHQLLARYPIEDLVKLDGWDLARLLGCQPQFADKCPWEKLDGRDWGDLLAEQPQFEDRCPWEKLDGASWAYLLGRQPQFADKCLWEKLDGGDWGHLLGEQPQFADRCYWEKLNSCDLIKLLFDQPRFADKCPWERFMKSIVADLCRSPSDEKHYEFDEAIFSEGVDLLSWYYLFDDQPQLIDKIPWELLDGHDWACLLQYHPQFASRCPWEKLDETDRALLRGDLNLVNCSSAKCSKDANGGEDGDAVQGDFFNLLGYGGKE
ncbi:MAG: ATP-binding protein [Kiritimatiellae bacterium]|nr:ATP-binding protein [Kiritimatiellia bacterium]